MADEKPTDIVGHVTYDDGPGKFRHEPLTREVADALWAAAEAAKKRRADAMPTEREAIHVMHDAWLRLKELGWHEAQYAPKAGPAKRIAMIEIGSTGVHEGYRDDISFWIQDDDTWPSRPVLYRGVRPTMLGQAINDGGTK